MNVVGQPSLPLHVSPTSPNLLMLEKHIGIVVIIFGNFYSKQKLGGNNVSNELENT